MEFTTSPSDVIRVAELAKQIEANPFSLAGRLIGLGTEEQRAGVPAWAWTAVALGLGFWLGMRYGPKVTKSLGIRRGST
jgi:hypothetical protein